MRKALWALASILLTLFVGCGNDKKGFENPQQQAFDDFLATKKKALYSQGNEIQKKEFINQFEKDLYSYIDSVGLFVNWQGQIADIKTKESGSLTALNFTIYYKPEKYREVKFHCTHLVNTDSLNNDYIYNIVKNIPDNTTVYFDGFMRTTNNDEIQYYMNSSGDDLNISYPQYLFWILDISPEKRKNTLSPDMQNAVAIATKINTPLKKQFKGLITKEESDFQFDELTPSYENACNILSDKEKQYIKRFNTCFVYNYLYGGK